MAKKKNAHFVNHIPYMTERITSPSLSGCEISGSLPDLLKWDDLPKMRLPQLIGCQTNLIYDVMVDTSNEKFPRGLMKHCLSAVRLLSS